MMKKYLMSMLTITIMLFCALFLYAQMMRMPLDEQLKSATLVVLAQVTEANVLEDKAFYEAGRATLKIEEIFMSVRETITVDSEVTLLYPTPAPKGAMIMDYVGMIFSPEDRYIFFLQDGKNEGEFEFVATILSRVQVERRDEVLALFLSEDN